MRAILKEAKLDLKKNYPALDKKKTLGQVLLEPTRIYVKPVLAAVEKFRKSKAITGMAHITGFPACPADNVCRALPSHLDAKIYKQSVGPAPGVPVPAGAWLAWPMPRCSTCSTWASATP